MKTVLIADDSRTTQLLVRTTLQRLPDTSFLAADNGREALELIGSQHVDLLVTDINMPELDGVELVREVRKRHTQSELPILLITAKGEDLARQQGLANGANGYLLKPLSGRELLFHAEKLLTTRPA
jgi:two-component system chemotaxis response regulator CheY